MTRHSLSTFLFIVVITFFMSCTSDNDDSQPGRDLIGITELDFKHYRTTGTGIDLGLFNVVKRSDEEIFGIFYSGVNGFQPELGIDYRIEVAEFSVDQPLADASSIEYDFVKIIEQSPGSSTEEFELVLKRQYSNGQESFITGSSVSNYALLDAISIDCNDLCEELEQPLNDQQTLYGVFTRNENNAYVLVSTRID